MTKKLIDVDNIQWRQVKAYAILKNKTLSGALYIILEQFFNPMEDFHNIIAVKRLTDNVKKEN